MQHQNVARQYPVSSVGTFLKFVIGFTTFIAISFAVTLGVSKLSTGDTQQQTAAAALAQMMKPLGQQ